MRLGPLAASSPIENIGLQWGFIALLSLTGLSLTALLAERRRDLDQLNTVAERYQRLFKSNPSPLWVAEPNDGRILMVNDEALRHYGFSEAEFLAMTVAELKAESVATPATASDRSVSGGDDHTVRHRTRAGTIIDVTSCRPPSSSMAALPSCATPWTSRTAWSFAHGFLHRWISSACASRRNFTTGSARY